MTCLVLVVVEGVPTGAELAPVVEPLRRIGWCHVSHQFTPLVGPDCSAFLPPGQVGRDVQLIPNIEKLCACQLDPHPQESACYTQGHCGGGNGHMIATAQLYGIFRDVLYYLLNGITKRTSAGISFVDGLRSGFAIPIQMSAQVTVHFPYPEPVS